MFIFKTLKNFFLKDEVVRKENVVKTAGEKVERLLRQKGLTLKNFFEIIEDANYPEGLEEMFREMNNILLPLLLIEDELYGEIKDYLSKRISSKRFVSALKQSNVLKGALFFYKSDIAKNLKQYLIEKEKHLEETNILDKFLLQGVSRKYTSVKRKKTFKARNNRKKKRILKVCRYFSKGFCKHGKNCKFRHQRENSQG